MLGNGDDNDLERIVDALKSFSLTKGRPTLIILDTHIGYGSPHRHDTSAAHGEPLGVEEVKLTKKAYGWPEDAQFLVPDGVREHFAAGIGERGRLLREAWMAHCGRARGRAVPRPRRRARALRGRDRRARAPAARGVDGALRALRGGAPRPR